MKFTVKNVIDGDTIEVSPNWEWNENIGKIVRILGYDTPEKGMQGYGKSKSKLEDLLLNKDVILKNPVRISYDRLLCEVYCNDKNIASYFPEYQ